MNKEIHHEGWLIKSPPTKRILRARWRKRWFTLKQGEIPGQFCLEYYTDRNCRKLKGVIDLDQCEQVDSGLHLEHRKQKFQYMFDIKTPNRIYYLAAETENDMRDWVNCICQVCNLHDFTKQPGERQYYNLCDHTYNQSLRNSITTNSVSNNSSAEVTTLDKSTAKQRETIHQKQQSNIPDLIRQTENTAIGTYQNSEFHYVNTAVPFGEIKAPETALAENATLERTQSLRSTPASLSNDLKTNDRTINHNRSQSLSEHTTMSFVSSSSPTLKTVASSTGVIKKIPENLVLSDAVIEGCMEPSPALSTCSGPYIPISECYSGTKFMCDDNPTTPLNNLDPKFYATPRTNQQIGLNLTVGQSYSPKIYNCPHQIRPRSGRSSPTDSESVFTDDEDWSHSTFLREGMDRNARPSDSSLENEPMPYTYKQRFSKMPDVNKDADDGISNENHESTFRLAKLRKHLGSIASCEDEKNREIISDTENTSPAIGPKDASSCVEESYDIPRSHNLPYYNLNPFNPTSPAKCKDFIRSSTPNLNFDTDPIFSPISSKTLPRPHFYTNAAPTTTEGNVFRYDFIEQPGAPAVNRSLKPRLTEEKILSDDKAPLRPPSVDRKLKPAMYKDTMQQLIATSSRRATNPKSLVMCSDIDFSINHKDLETRTLPRNISTLRNVSCNTQLRSSTTTLQSSPKSNPALQYLELDVSNPPPPRLRNANSILMISGEPSHSHSLDIPKGVAMPSSVEYKCVDFLKTEAFKRVKEDAEKNRMKD